MEDHKFMKRQVAEIEVYEWKDERTEVRSLGEGRELGEVMGGRK